MRAIIIIQQNYQTITWLIAEFGRTDLIDNGEDIKNSKLNSVPEVRLGSSGTGGSVVF